MIVDTQLNQLRGLIDESDAILVGAGAGMSIPAGIDLDDREAFKKNYPAMTQYGFEYGYQLLGYPYQDDKLRWGYLSASLMDSARLGRDETYQNLKTVLADKNHFIMTTNVDRLFYKNGFDGDKIYTPQGDSFLFQCKTPCSQDVWDALPLLKEMEQHIDPETQMLTDDKYVPTCPHCGGEVYMNVRSGPFYISKHYEPQHERLNQWLTDIAGKKLLLLEIGVGFNTPGVIRAPFEHLAKQIPNCTLVRINPKDAHGPEGTLSVQQGIKETLSSLVSA